MKHRDEKILMLSSSVVCLSLTILNIFENKKGIIRPRKINKCFSSQPTSFFGATSLFLLFVISVFFCGSEVDLVIQD